MSNGIVNCIPEKDFNKENKVKVVNFPGGFSEKILGHLEQIIKEKPDIVMAHIGTNDLTCNVDLLNNAKKILKVISKDSPSINLAFLSLITRKDKRTSRKT